MTNVKKIPSPSFNLKGSVYTGGQDSSVNGYEFTDYYVVGQTTHFHLSVFSPPQGFFLRVNSDTGCLAQEANQSISPTINSTAMWKVSTFNQLSITGANSNFHNIYEVTSLTTTDLDIS